jgi:hypothetical protein
MARARIELVKAESYSARGRVFHKGHPVIVDSDSDISYFKSQPEFTVTMLKAPAPVAPPPPPVVDEDEDEDEDEADKPVVLEQKDLESMSKADLSKLGADRFALDLDTNVMKKPAMVEAILKAQSEETSE